MRSFSNVARNSFRVWTDGIHAAERAGYGSPRFQPTRPKGAGYSSLGQAEPATPVKRRPGLSGTHPNAPHRGAIIVVDGIQQLEIGKPQQVAERFGLLRPAGAHGTKRFVPGAALHPALRDSLASGYDVSTCRGGCWTTWGGSSPALPVPLAIVAKGGLA